MSDIIKYCGRILMLGGLGFAYFGMHDQTKDLPADLTTMVGFALFSYGYYKGFVQEFEK